MSSSDAGDPFALVGQSIDEKFRVDAIIGEGGFGVVYRGHHLAFDQAIAIKCLKIPGHLGLEGRNAFLDRFREEGKLLAKLSKTHPAIVQVYDFGTTRVGKEDVPFLVLEWLEGESLEHYANGRAFSEREALALVMPAIEAVAEAHDLKIAHRDLKPENLFISKGTRNLRTRVLDFGIAKVMQEGEAADRAVSRTSSGFSAFSPPYAAAEQFLPKKFGPTGPWTDVHAFGLILTKLVTGRVPYDGETAHEILEEAVAVVRPTPRGRGADVSDAFEAIVGRALTTQASGRFQDARALADAIREADSELRATTGVAIERLAPPRLSPDAYAATNFSAAPQGVPITADAPAVFDKTEFPDPVIGRAGPLMVQTVVAPLVAPASAIPKQGSSMRLWISVAAVVAVFAVGGVWLNAKLTKDSPGVSVQPGPDQSPPIPPTTGAPNPRVGLAAIDEINADHGFENRNTSPVSYWETAQKDFESAATHPEAVLRTISGRDWALGELEYHRGNYPAAEHAFRKAIDEEPNWALPYAGLSKALTRLDRADDALVAAKQAVDHDSSSTLAHCALAHVYEQRDDYGAAIEEYELARKLMRKPSASFLAALAMAYHERHETQSAMNNASTALRYDPKTSRRARRLGRARPRSIRRAPRDDAIELGSRRRARKRPRPIGPSRCTGAGG